MTQPSQTRKTSFRGKELELQDLLPSQELLMVKIARDLRRAANEGNNNILEAAKLLDILETALVNPEDVDFIEGLIIKRQLDLKEVIYLLAGKEEETEKPKVVRRGRPPKSRAA
jgi:hypothetical protein